MASTSRTLAKLMLMRVALMNNEDTQASQCGLKRDGVVSEKLYFECLQIEKSVCNFLEVLQHQIVLRSISNRYTALSG